MIGSVIIKAAVKGDSASNSLPELHVIALLATAVVSAPLGKTSWRDLDSLLPLFVR